MPASATERFARTYTPRVPDDSYDSLGGVNILNSVIRAPMERPFEEVIVRASFSNGILVQTLVPVGQIAQVNLFTGFTSGTIQTSGIGEPVQYDSFAMTVSLAGGTLH
jgi:hypothetical protein